MQSGGVMMVDTASEVVRDASKSFVYVQVVAT
jgi:hypothetical protein